MRSGHETAAMVLAGAWLSWNESGSVLDQLGKSTAQRLFRDIGPFTANVRILADDKGSVTTSARFGVPGIFPQLHRGAVSSGRDGMSWTDSMMVALSYAWQSDGSIFTCQFERSEFLALISYTYEDNPGRSEFEWVMLPNGKASLWVPPWLDATTPEAIAADHDRMKIELEEFLGPGDYRAREMRRASPHRF